MNNNNQLAYTILRNFSFLKGFTSKTLKKFIDHVELVSIPHHGLICRQGDPFTHFYLVLYGEYDQQWCEMQQARN